jgi:hypothetical protein
VLCSSQDHLRTETHNVHNSCFQVLYFLIHCLQYCTHSSCEMASEADQTLLAAGDAVASDSKVASGVESDIAPAYSSFNAAMQAIVEKTIPMLHNYWKKSTVTEVDHTAYHAIGWLLGGVVSSISNLEFPIVDNTPLSALNLIS